MKCYKQLFVFIFLVACSFAGYAQYVHDRSDKYTWPEDPQVLDKLDRWQDQKFGLLIHWGLYSVPGIVESWSICSEEEDWIPRDSTIAYDAYKKWYWGLKDQFNPTRFDPGQWARAAKDAGMRYAIFTTKHHDGFNLFNTAYSDFSIAKGPFKDDPCADAAKYVFQAFRDNNLMVGAYFSKPDWHSEYYWWPRYATPTRHQNYKIEKNPGRWNQFKNFTFNQISELMHNYGSIDILWLDGGWVNSPYRKTEIDMPRIAAMARKAQPGILVVDRGIHGPYENYQTPEQQIPDEQLPFPWESCLSLSKDWGYVPGAIFKSPTTVVTRLMEIVAKGGCLLLGAGPSPEGVFPDEVVTCFQQIGEWMKLNGEAIYSTRITPCYHSGDVWFTANKDKKTLYALYAVPEDAQLPKFIEWETNIPLKGSSVISLQDGKKVKWENRNGRIRVYLPKHLKTEVKALAFSFRIAD